MRFLVVLVVLAACTSKPSPAPTTPPARVATGDCPATAPAHGSPCGRLLARCSYPGEPRCPFAHCADQASQLVWQTTFDRCPIACPATKPTAGTACSPVTHESCHYKGGAKCGFQLHCGQTGWVEQELTLCDGM